MSTRQLKNRLVAVEIDRKSGAVRSIHDKELKSTYALAGIGFEVTTATGIVRSVKALSADIEGGEAVLCFADGGLEVKLHYTLGAEDRFVEKWNPSLYLFGRGVSCPASDDYMKHALAFHEAVFTQYQRRWWGWDGRWLSYWEVPSFRPGPLGLGADPCFARNHGHLPGDNRYKERVPVPLFGGEAGGARLGSAQPLAGIGGEARDSLSPQGNLSSRGGRPGHLHVRRGGPLRRACRFRRHHRAGTGGRGSQGATSGSGPSAGASARYPGVLPVARRDPAGVHAAGSLAGECAVVWRPA